LREGLEDYEYLWLLNGGDPVIGVPNEADALTGSFIASRTRFSRVPTDLYATRAAVAARLTAPSVSKSASRPAVAPGETLTYTLAYRAGNLAHTVSITDEVPAATTVLTATGSAVPAPSVAGQRVTWSVPVSAHSTVTLTIAAQATTTGPMTNTAIFSGTHLSQASARVLVYRSQIFLPLVLRR
jgi:uncharacterized repeat protein (TIGR01451 family)